MAKTTDKPEKNQVAEILRSLSESASNFEQLVKTPARVTDSALKISRSK